MQSYELRADDVVLWTGRKLPTQLDIDRAAADANARGWNGITLEVWIRKGAGAYRCGDVSPSEEVLS